MMKKKYNIVIYKIQKEIEISLSKNLEFAKYFGYEKSAKKYLLKV